MLLVVDDREAVLARAVVEVVKTALGVAAGVHDGRCFWWPPTVR
jgi:hypothetical protein